MTKIILTGVNLLSKNRGVQALGFGAVDFLKLIFPDSEITVLSSTGETLENSQVEQTNLTKKDYLKFLIYYFFPFLSSHDSKIEKIKKADYIFDLTEGDSFTDLYGIKRLLRYYILKTTLIKFNKKYVFLQQTIGPFQKKYNLFFAKQILKASYKVYVRDYDSFNLMKKLGLDTLLLPDIAFFMDKKKTEKYIIPFSNYIGINVNGFLYSNTYKNNILDQKEYTSLIENCIQFLLEQKENVLLIPHTYSTTESYTEDDLQASLAIYAKFKDEFKSQIAVMDQDLNAAELKYVFSKAKFVVASRMHACIGTLTSGKLAIGLAYSYKFRGAFKNLGFEDWVINLYEKGEYREAFQKLLQRALKENQTVSKTLIATVERLKNETLEKFKKDLLR